MSQYFLAKTDPETYDISQLRIDNETDWDGVHNHQALAVIKSWKPGDLVLIYHSQGEARIVGLAEVTTLPEKDPNDSRGISWYARLRFIREFSEEQKVGLKEIKDSGLFNDFLLVRQGRLSTMACPETFVNWLKEKGLNLNRN